MANEVSIIETVLTAKTEDHDRKLAESEQKLNDFGKGASDAGFQQWSSKVSASAVAMGNIIASAALKAIEAVKDMVTAVASSGIAFNAMKEQATVAFTSLLGSAQKAKGFLEELQAFANKTPFEFPDVVRAAQKFTAMGFSAKQVVPILTAVGDAVAAMGGGAQQIDRVTTALVQMQAKGKVSAEEMRQLAESGIPAWQILAEKIGKSIPEAMKLAEQGAISANFAVGALVEGMEEKFGGMMEKQSHSWNGLVSTIRDTFNIITGQIMQPFFEFARDGMQKFVDVLPQIQEAISHVQQWFSDTFSGVRTVVGDAITAIVAFYQTHKTDIQEMVNHAGRLIQDYINAWGGVVQQVKDSISRILDDLHQMGISNEDIWNGVVNTIHAAITMISLTIRSITLVVQGVVKAIEFAWSTTYTILIKPIADAIAWARANIPIIGSLIDAVAARAAAAMNIYRGLSSAIEKSPKIGELGESVEKSFTLSKEAAGRIVDNFNKVGLEAHKSFASGIAGKSKGGGGGGKSEIAAAMKENLDVINEWLNETGARINISKRDWDTLSTSIQENMLKQARAFEVGKTSTKEFFLQMKGGIITTQEMGQAFADFVKTAEQGAKIIATALPKVSLEFIKVKDDIGGLNKAKKDLEEADKKLTQATIKESEERIKQADREFHDLTKVYQDLSRNLPDSWNKILDAVINASGKIGDELIKHAIKVKGWANDIIGVIDTLPGHFGDVARKVVSTVDQWIEFGDKVLAVLHRLSDNIPGSIGDLFTKLKGAFSSGFSSLIGIVTAGVGSILGGFSLITGAKGGLGGLLQGGIGGALLGFGAGSLSGAAIGGLFGSVLPGLGTAIGAAVGALFGLFKGKSQAQKDAEAAAKKQAALATQDMFNAVNEGILETMSKGATLLEQISGFTDLPRKQIKRFINQLTDVLLYFVEAAKEFETSAALHAKEISDALGSSIELMLGGAQLIEAIRNVGELSDAKIKLFIDTVMKIADMWLLASQDIEKGLAKRAEKISTLLSTSFEFLQMIPDVIKGFLEVPETITDEQLNRPFDYAKQIIDKMFQLADQFKEYALKKTAKITDDFGRIFTNTKSIFETLKVIGEYVPLPETVFDNVNNDFQRVTDWLDGMIATVMTWLDKSEILNSDLAQFIANLNAGLSSLTGAVGGGENIGLQPTAASNPLGLASIPTGGGSTFGAPLSSASAPIVINIYGDVLNEGQFQDKVVRAISEAERRGRLSLA